MTEVKFEDKHRNNNKNDVLEILPMDSNLLLANSSFNFFETTNKKQNLELNED